jgi:sodium/bile acid cotransporter 7
MAATQRMSSASGPKRTFKPDWFLLGMLAAAVLAWQWPDVGARGGSMHAEVLTKLGIALIFFLHGLAISFAALKAGTLRWPLHLVVQSCTFLIFPLIGLAIFHGTGQFVPPDLALGFFFLCALPSTVSSSVALTAVARGNVPAAVFNATLSNLLGVVVTPLWVGVVANAAGHELPIGSVMLELVEWLVLPLIAGQICRRWWGAWAGAHKPLIHVLDRGTILLLVFSSLCESMKQGVWSRNGLNTVWLTVAGDGLIFGCVMLMVGALCNALRFSREDKITAMFCGSKKTLAAGVSMVQLMFAGHPGIGLILLPMMVYHPLQLVISSMLAARWAHAAAPTTGDVRVVT